MLFPVQQRLDWAAPAVKQITFHIYNLDLGMCKHTGCNCINQPKAASMLAF